MCAVEIKQTEEAQTKGDAGKQEEILQETSKSDMAQSSKSRSIKVLHRSQNDILILNRGVHLAL